MLAFSVMPNQARTGNDNIAECHNGLYYSYNSLQCMIPWILLSPAKNHFLSHFPHIGLSFDVTPLSY